MYKNLHNFKCFSTLNCVQTKKILSSEYQTRRKKLITTILLAFTETNAQKTSDCLPIAFLHSKKKTFSAPNVPHVFRQCSNFRYLTGFDAKDSAQLVMHKNESVFFIDKQSNDDLLWNGKSLSPEEIILISGVDKVLPFSEFDAYMASIVSTKSILATDLETLKADAYNDPKCENALKYLNAIPIKMTLKNEIDKIRWQKSDNEISLMRKSCEIGAATMNSTIIQSKSFTNESHLVGLLEFEARRRGAQFLAYPPVVASGSNANTIHYISSKKDMKKTDCVLIDAGCDFEGYVSDITRCFPLNGLFSDSQRSLYDALNHVQSELLKYTQNVRPLTLNNLYMEMLQLLATTLSSITFFKPNLSLDTIIFECEKLCPHHVSHYLGMDVHDTPTISRNIEIPSGVVITIEPGVYVNENNTNVYEEFHGLGFRIEDNVLITDTGIENLTKSCVRNSEDIELMLS